MKGFFENEKPTPSPPQKKNPSKFTWRIQLKFKIHENNNLLALPW